MTPFPYAPLFVLILGTAACSGGPGDSMVNGGTGANTGIPTGQPNLGPSVGTGTGTGTGVDGTGNGTAACGANLTGRVRDFKGADLPGGHPDFETFSGSKESPGIVQAMLGADKKPVYAPAANMPMVSMYGQQTTDKAHYDQWYRDTDGVNMPIDFTVPLSQRQNGTSFYDNDAFFPIDKQGFGDYKDSGHNFHFTFELHTEFQYKGNEVFTFTGDDDLWVFVNGHLGIDLGGLHPQVSQVIDLAMRAKELGLEVGKTYPLDLFHAERHTTASHFRVETSIEFTNCNPIIIPK
jgi:fibro-slime domain-containing protein